MYSSCVEGPIFKSSCSSSANKELFWNVCCHTCLCRLLLRGGGEIVGLVPFGLLQLLQINCEVHDLLLARQGQWMTDVYFFLIEMH